MGCQVKSVYKNVYKMYSKNELNKYSILFYSLFQPQDNTVKITYKILIN